MKKLRLMVFVVIFTYLFSALFSMQNFAAASLNGVVFKSSDSYLGHESLLLSEMKIPKEKIKFYTSEHFQLILSNNNKVKDEELKKIATYFEDAWSLFIKQWGFKEPVYSYDSNKKKYLDSKYKGKKYKINIYLFGNGLEDYKIDGGPEVSRDSDGFDYMNIGLGYFESRNIYIGHEFFHICSSNYGFTKMSYPFEESVADWFGSAYQDYYSENPDNRSLKLHGFEYNSRFGFTSEYNAYNISLAFDNIVKATNPTIETPTISDMGKAMRVFCEAVSKIKKDNVGIMEVYNKINKSKIPYKQWLIDFYKRVPTFDFPLYKEANLKEKNEIEGDIEYSMARNVRDERRKMAKLSKVTGAEGWWQPSPEYKPYYNGFNTIPLTLTNSNEKTIQISLESAANNDCIGTFVEVLSDGKAKYSPYIYSKKPTSYIMSSEINKLYLVVACTPKNATSGKELIGNYKVYLKNAKPDNTTVLKETSEYAKKRLSALNENLIVHANGGGYKSATAMVDESVFIDKNAVVLGNAKIMGNAKILGNAVVGGEAVISDNAVVEGYAVIHGNSKISGNAHVSEGAYMFGGTIKDNAVVSGKATVEFNSIISGSAKVYQNANISSGNDKVPSIVMGDIEVKGWSRVFEKTLPSKEFPGGKIIDTNDGGLKIEK